MQKLDTERLVRKLAVLDNRQVNDGVVDTWHELVGHLSYPVAELALLKARQDVNINWVEPKHILAKSREAIAELNETDRGSDGAEDWQRAPEPKCVAHGLRITGCPPCTELIFEQSKVLPSDRLHLWAVGNVYQDEIF